MRTQRWVSILAIASQLLVVPLFSRAGEPPAEVAPQAPAHRATGVIWNEILATRDLIAFQNDQEDMEKVTAAANQLNALSLEIFNSMKDRLELHQRVHIRRALKLIPFLVMRISDRASRGIPGQVRELLPELDHDLEFIRGEIPDELLDNPEAAPPDSSTKAGD